MIALNHNTQHICLHGCKSSLLIPVAFRFIGQYKPKILSIHFQILLSVYLTYTRSVNPEILARDLFSQNVAGTKFHENKTLEKWRNHSVVY